MKWLLRYTETEEDFAFFIRCAYGVIFSLAGVGVVLLAVGAYLK